MNFKPTKNIHPSADAMSKIYSITWSSNLMRLAVAFSDRSIWLFDENGEKREKFSTKAGSKSNKSYVVRDTAFSPDSTKLAVAQSDNIVFIYKLGNTWGEKKSICNKFAQNSPVTCLVWPKDRHSDIYFGLAEGKVKVGILKSNTSQNLYSTDSFVVSIASSPDSKFLLSGHLDGVIYKFNIENGNLQKMVIHPSVPYCLGWGNDILAAGNDYKVIFYNDIGSKIQTFDYTNDDKIKEFTVCKVSPSGDCIAVGNYNRFFVYLFNNKKSQWEEAFSKYIENLYSVTALCWKPDGSSLITGSLCGSVDLFEACVKKSVYKEKFEITYVSHTQVVVKNLETLRRLVLKPQYSTEITKININLDNYLVLFTKESLILGDIDQEKYSELQWNPSGDEKFDFTNNNVCMIYNAGELTLVEYGNSQILGYCKTEYIHSNLISARLNYNVQAGIGKTTAIKIIAYLIDLNTIQIQDLSTQNMLCSINHDSKVDFLELNKNGTKLIFRDRKRHLYLYYVFDQKKVTLLNYCGYVQWVPNSDVLVAQDRKNLCVWYNVDDPDKVRIINVKGEVEEIRRKEGKTEVIVEEGNNSQIYLLDDGLIAFSTAIDEGDLNKAVKILENLEMNSDIETHWKTLAKLAISSKQLVIAQRCYAAIGSYSKANYVKKIIKIAEKNGIDSPLVEARLLIFDKQFSNAENLLINNKQLNEAMEIMNDMQKWEESIKLAVKYNHPEADNIKRQFYDWLIDSDQLDKAAEIKEQEGQFKEAIDLYLKGGYPVKAGNVIKNYNAKFDKDIIEQIINALLNVGIYEKAGELLEILGQYKRALEAFVEAKSYSKAVEVAKKHLPKLVEKLEDDWGDWLMSQKQLEAAITHFIEAGSRTKAIEAAIGARKWDKAIELSNSINNESARPYLSMIGDHFAMQRLTDTAEKYYLKAKEPVKAFNMYVKYGRWDKAEQIIKKSMKDEDFSKTIVNEAIKYEQDGKLKEAEKLYIMAGEQDIAINMYRTAKQYDNMIRLVSTYRPDYLKSTHMLVAQLLEADKNLKQAEHHLVEAGNWKGAVEMYRAHNMWEEALRVAKTNGMKAEINEIAKKWVNNLPKDQATKMLMSMGLVEAAIDIEVDKKDFDNAFDIANKHAKYRVPYVHLKYAMFLEDEKRYHDAEEHYIKANQVEDVIQMYESQYDFQSALRVARQHDPQYVIKIYFNQGNYFLERREFSKAEMCFVNSKQPEVMINAYRKMKMIKEAIAFAKKHIPAIVEDLVRLMIPDESSGVNGAEMLDNARYCEDAKDYYKAVEIYLEINESHFDNPDKLEEIWMKAVQIASTFLKNNASEIIFTVAEKLRRIGRFRRAANLYETLGKIKEAIDSLIDGELWEPAHNLVNSIKDAEKHKQLQEYLISREQQGAYDKNDPLELCKLGDARGLEMFLKRGDIEKTLECADKFFSREIYNKYLIQIAYNLLQEKNLAGAAGLIAKNNAPIFKNNLKFYTKLALEILAEENLNEITNLKEMLYAVMNNLNANEFPNEFQELSRLQKITYYQFLKLTCKNNQANFKKTYFRLCLSVLSYGDIIKLDLALLDAGLICRELGFKGNAFILLNRYLDIYEVIEDNSNKLEEEGELKDTEIPQVDVYMSESNIINAQTKKDIHDWIVKANIDKSFEKTLSRKACLKCNKNIFEANLKCKSCNFQYDQCVVSGFPIFKANEAVGCSSCGKKALRECWNEWIGANEQCPWCKSIQMTYK